MAGRVTLGTSSCQVMEPSRRQANWPSCMSYDGGKVMRYSPPRSRSTIRSAAAVEANTSPSDVEVEAGLPLSRWNSQASTAGRLLSTAMLTVGGRSILPGSWPTFIHATAASPWTCSAT